jgi:hypothetical protein
MRAIVRVSRHVFIAAVAVVMAACANQMEPAQKAIADIEAAVTATAADAGKYIPEQLAAVQGGVDSLKAAFDKKDYKSVITGAPAVLADAQGLAAAAAAKKDEVMAALNGEWTQLSTDLPAAVTSIQARIDELAKARKLPEGLDKAAVEGAGAALAETQTMWTEASNAFSAGSLEDAVAKATAVKAKVGELMTTLGMTTPAA